MPRRKTDRSRALAASESLPETTEGPSPVNRHFTFWLDDVFRVPGTGIRFGFDPLLTFFPAAGNVVATALGGVVILDAVRLRTPIPVLLRMLGNYAINWLLGSVPLIGSFFDALWRSNVKNLALLRRTIENREQVRRASISYWLVALALVLGITALLLIIPVVLLFWFFNLWLGR